MSVSIAVGEQVGPYRIDRVLGAGGMGVVYLARDSRQQRTVAIKVVDRTRHGDEGARLLIEEARMTAALNHPSICCVHEVGHLGAEQFIVMEHVEGTTLAAVIASASGLTIESALHFGRQLADAVAHAHHRGITHGDLKSSNVIVGRGGSLKVLDFGLAVRQVPLVSGNLETTRPTEPSSGAGTVPYMAPELLRGHRPDARSDVWALGIILFEMLTGARPFHGATVYELAASVLSDPLPELPTSLPEAVTRVIRRCLAKTASDRYPSAADLAHALNTIQ